jgi:aspartyl-tRNA(Asn)/glutamyl-tRNA(Gln) amidotransferase subunit A
MLTTLSLHDAAAGLRARTFSSVELTRAYLERIERLNPTLNAFITITADQALAQASDADARRSAGEDTPLLGIPIAAKDLFNTRDVRTTAGSKMLDHYVPVWDATVIARLRSQGAVMLGKLNCDQFGMGSSNENTAFGPTRNPWDVSRVPGGSSGGSAAAVAAELCVAALGTDTGGSIRQPASHCGVTGLKNSYGRVSRYGVIAFASSLDTVGAITRDVRDAEIMLHAMAGRDAHDSTSVDFPLSPSSRPDTLRVGVPAEYFIEGIQPDVEAAVRAAIDHYRTLGAEIVPVALPNTRLAMPVYYLIAPAEVSANMSRFDGVRFGARVTGADLIDSYKQSRSDGLGAEVKRRIMIGTYVLSAGYYDAYYIRAQKVRTLIKRDFETAFNQVDVIACPVAPSTAFLIGEKSEDPVQMYLADVFTLAASLAGIPAISIPCGTDARGLPIGLQIIGPAFREDAVLGAAALYQSTTTWHSRRPSL